MNPPFEVGDRVVCVDRTGSLVIGNDYIVSQVNMREADGQWFVGVKEIESSNYYDYRFKLIGHAEEPKQNASLFWELLEMKR